jgi:microcystin-dependent protein
MAGYNFQPQGYALCNGQTLPIAQNTALFALIGTTYGGDGQTTFNLPDLRSRVPIHQGQGNGLSSYQTGEASGVETITLTAQQMPQHSHNVNASSAHADQMAPAGNLLGAGHSPGSPPYKSGGVAPNATLSASTIANTGGSQPHSNLQPFLCISFYIALAGALPQRS